MFGRSYRSGLRSRRYIECEVRVNGSVVREPIYSDKIKTRILRESDLTTRGVGTV